MSSSVPAYWIRLSATRLVRLLWCIVAGLLIIHLTLQTVKHFGVDIPWDLHLVFDVDGEPTVPTWYSSMALLFGAMLALLIARERRRAGDRDAGYWHWLAAGIMFLSLDEIAALHEMVNTFVDVEWTIWGGALLVTVGLIFIPFLMRLQARTRIRLVVAGFVFAAGAVVVEHLSGPEYFHYDMDSIQYAYMTALEEGLEMSGGVLIIRALLLEMASRNGKEQDVDVGIEAAS